MGLIGKNPGMVPAAPLGPANHPTRAAPDIEPCPRTVGGPMATIVDDSTAEEPSNDLSHGGRGLFPRPDLIEDPRVLAYYLEVMAPQHRSVGRGRYARCACGEPYATCAVAIRLAGLSPTNGPESTTTANQWFG
jgi:hypothetical protein